MNSRCESSQYKSETGLLFLYKLTILCHIIFVEGELHASPGLFHKAHIVFCEDQTGLLYSVTDFREQCTTVARTLVETFRIPILRLLYELWIEQDFLNLTERYVERHKPTSKLSGNAWCVMYRTEELIE